MKYDHLQIEKKWQDYWDHNKTFRTPDISSLDTSKKKYYVADMFPYPSGEGLHVGHPEGYTATDIIARYKRMRGFNVLHPMGWDAFGLPAEQYAVKTGIHPKITTAKSIGRFKSQLKQIGFSIDWEREINTTDENFVKWTQWIFLKIFNSYYDDALNKARPIDELEIPEGLNEKEKYEFINSKRLAYLAEVPVNWCPELGTVLANEEVPEQIEKGFTVIRKPMKQWMLRITKYAERLLNDLDKISWSLKELQKNWIGRSEGALIKFNIEGSSHTVEVFTTRPDTIYGATYIVLAPEHTLVREITTPAQEESVINYIDTASRKSDMERTELAKDKTGVWTGTYAINPLSKEEIPIWISDYVLISYGTGAIMAVPGHDTRDFEFANKFGIKILPVLVEKAEQIKDNEYLKKAASGETCFTGEGFAVNSGDFSGLPTKQAKEKIIKYLEQHKIGKSSISYKLRDWLFSRQRYWGEPFPIIHFDDGTIKAIDETELPLKLPEVESYKPSGTGESPLATIDEWVQTKDKGTGRSARRETNTMPNWAGSCWYFLRYIDPDNDKIFCNKEKEKYWMPIDLYIGGAEHAVLHLLYARFWYKVLYDLGYVNYEEPFRNIFNQGMILGEDGVKMSKSRGNVINPEDVIRDFGADSLRLFEMFMGPLEAVKPWNTKGIEGINRFLNRVWRLIIDESKGELKPNIKDNYSDDHIQKIMHQTIRKVTLDIDEGGMKFNTSIAQLMTFTNELYKATEIDKNIIEILVLLLSPFAPHICEELWEKLGKESSIQLAGWPQYNNELAKEEQITIVFSINGKPRSKADFSPDTDEETVKNAALADEKITRHINGKQIVKVISVKNKMVNIVVR